LEGGRPARITTDRRGLTGGPVEAAAGPWRTSGAWWTAHVEASQTGLAGCCRNGGDGAWDRDEWDVTLGDGATYRLFRERTADAWFVEGIVD
jgi:protein ImuB